MGNAVAETVQVWGVTVSAHGTLDASAAPERTP